MQHLFLRRNPLWGESFDSSAAVHLEVVRSYPFPGRTPGNLEFTTRNRSGPRQVEREPDLMRGLCELGYKLTCGPAVPNQSAMALALLRTPSLRNNRFT